jgi:hypothetical protein
MPPELYKAAPLSPFTGGFITTSAGYTQRMQPVVSASFSGQRTLQMYLPGIQMLAINGGWLHDLSDAGNREADKGTLPYQSFHVYTVTLSSPDGDLPYKKGDNFVPNGNLVGLVANTQHTIAGIQQYPTYAELILWRKL